MEQPPTQHDHSLRRLMRGLDPVPALLFTVAVGLAILDVTCYAALSLVSAPFSMAEGAPEAAKPKPLHGVGRPCQPDFKFQIV